MNYAMQIVVGALFGLGVGFLGSSILLAMAGRLRVIWPGCVGLLCMVLWAGLGSKYGWVM